MLIPVKCFTCGKVIANKYPIYLERVSLLKKDKKDTLSVYPLEYMENGMV